MHLGFIDIEYGYAADRPDTGEPLGGTTSAICFLARELVKAGIDCTLFNKIPEARLSHAIPALPLQSLIDEIANPSYTAFIFCGRWLEDMVRLVKAGTSAPLIAWMHESSFHPKLVPALDIFKGVAFVSEWQKRINQPHAHPNWRQTVIRNAMNPQAAKLFASGEAIRAAKTTPPILLYAGSVQRGAFHLPKILEHLRPSYSDFTMEIFCNTNPSGHADSDTAYIGWLRGLQNVTHVGMVGQTELLARLKRAALLVSPNPWPETSCIALIEAMAAGLSVVTTNRAVLPETAAGFARHIPIEEPDHPRRFDLPVPCEAFAEAVREAIYAWLHRPEETEAKLRTQVDYCLENYQWRQRVQPWMEFVKSCL